MEIENKCFQIVKWHILKYSLDGQMRSLYEQKLNQEKEENLEKAEKQTEHHAWLWSDSKLLLSSMNALDKAKPQGKEKMSNKQQCGKLTELTRQEAEDKRIVMLMRYNMQ